MLFVTNLTWDSFTFFSLKTVKRMLYSGYVLLRYVLIYLSIFFLFQFSLDIFTIKAWFRHRTFHGVRTKHEPGVHGPPVWTGSMDHFHGPGPWTVFFNFCKKVLHQVHGHSKTEIVPKKDLTRRCRPMLTIDHKYLVVLTWRTLCLHMCSRKTVKLS